jgi:hypothetical protein
LLKIFSQEAEQEMIAALEPATEEEADNMDFVDLYEELEALERRVILQSQHIQQIRFETSGGAYLPREKLEEVGVEPTQEELTEANLSKEEAEQQLSDETTELESAAGWQASFTGEENNMRDHDDLPFGQQKKVQQRRLHKENQPVEQLDMVIEEIRRLMVRSAKEAVSKEKLNKGEIAIETRKKKQ